MLWNRNIDVYLNGKLARSCTLRSVPILNNGNLYINQDGGYKGDMSNLRYFNRAINAEQVQDIYQKGSSAININSIIPKFDFQLSASAKLK